MKSILRAGAVGAAFGVGLSLAVLPAVPASAATGGTRVPCNDITALKNAINRANSSGPNSAGSHITLASHCTYTLTAPDNTDDGLPEITGHVTISGRDTTIQRAPSATQNFRIFHVVSGGTLTANSLTISGGSVAGIGSGGGLAISSGTLNLNRSVVRNNSAVDGGGIGNLGGRVNLDRTTVERNTASDFGGAIINGNNGTLKVKGGSLLRNRALSIGGGLENIGGTASLDGVSVRDNTAPLGGGLRNVNGSTLSLKSTTVRENIATNGGGISNAGANSTVTLDRSLVTRNTAITAGGGILNQGGQVTLTNSKVIRNRPDNCSPAGSVPGCTNPASTVSPPTAQVPPAADIKKKTRK